MKILANPGLALSGFERPGHDREKALLSSFSHSLQ